VPTSLISTGVQYPDGSIQPNCITITGPSLSSNLSLGAPTTFIITEFDSYTTYNISTTNGSVSRSNNIITYTSNTAGAANIIVNGRTIGPFNVLPPIFFNTEYLVVAGGGPAGGFSGGGGGAGGLLTTSANTRTGLPYTLTVGAGGPRAGSRGVIGTNGSNSVFSSVTAIGGGAGAASETEGTRTGNTGGSGGGAGGGYTTPDPTAIAGGSGISGQGNNGGRSNKTSGSIYFGGGGGGAGVVGANANTTHPGNGGNGLQSSISGTNTYYAGGGAGGAGNGGYVGASGGLGGGGATNTTSGEGTPGTVNTGGGGGSSDWRGPVLGGSGGSGIIILKIPTPRTATFSAGVTSSLNTSVSGFNIYNITAAGPTDTVFYL
jgi:hypothetical protein